ncbi:UdgX family uracil-DNA binding protein [Starkeya koreensis]|uniref:Type-4 uracil-DNA glycosylase n=1 Tax=Ancylobacter koreensis TaxID=266121 RepID=A0ABT0DQ65_9HYPH|nr:UdgX family uracil-DNA binding protein [Ancylobacter koreensis]MCK0209252.1 UdgX family uracil-DNA binding protein [Ancylobacter koreensis]
MLRYGADHAGFRAAVRALVAQGVSPDRVVWRMAAAAESTAEAGSVDLFGTAAPAAAPADAPPLSLPRAVANLVDLVLCHRDPTRFALLYTLISRVLHGERQLADNPADPLVHRLGHMAKAVRRDIHKMHAFVRFKVRGSENGRERYLAWFEPEHFILEAAAPFFRTRFPAMDWAILTPLGTVGWNGDALAFGPPASRPPLPEGDGFEEGWLAYYASAFNPARANPAMMRNEMPRKYWPNLPEARIIPALLETAPARVAEMLAREAAAPRKRDPERAVAAMARQAPANLEELNAVIASTPPFVAGGTCAVLGEGPLNPRLALVGEQPGDQEDEAGRPFVGPAGQLLMKALGEAGLTREAVYLTNAVKHFKFVQRGKRRLHQKPTAGEVKHYRWWLEKELDFVRPRLVVALGGTAALALTGKALAVTRERGPHRLGAHDGYVTFHPSYLLRLPDEAARREAYAALVADLATAKALAA